MGTAGRTGMPRVGKLWVFVFCIFAFLYLCTAQTGCSWGDSGIFQWRVLHAEYVGIGGKELALAHPLYIAMARLWLRISPLGNPCWSISFFSGLGMALSLANLAIIFLVLCRDRLLSVLLAAMLGVCHTPWWLSTMAEVYTWSLAALTLEILLLLRFCRSPSWKILLVLLFVNGLGLCIHNFALLALPVYAGVVIVSFFRGRLQVRHVLAIGVAYVLGASPFLFLVLQRAMAEGSVLEAVGSALVGTWGSSVFASHVKGEASRLNAALVSLNFLNVLLPLVLAGLIGIRRLGRTIAWSLGLITAAHVLFVARYNVPDVFTFVLPCLAMISVFAAHGVHLLAGRSPRARQLVVLGLALSILLSPLAYGAAPFVLDQAGFVLDREGKAYPLRNELRFWITPWKRGEDSAERFALAALRQAAPDGIIRAGNLHLVYPMLLMRDRSPEYAGVDIGLYDKSDSDMSRLLTKNRHRPVFVVRSYLRKRITPAAVLRREGVLHRVTLDDIPAANPKTQEAE